MNGALCITENGLFGGAVFAGAGTFTRPAFQYSTINDPATNLFQHVKPAAGFGARVDFAWGVDSFAIHLGAGEVF